MEVTFNRGKNCVILDSDEEALLTTWQNLEEYMLKGMILTMHGNSDPLIK